MALRYENKEPRRLTVLRYSVRSLESLGDRAAYWMLMSSWLRYLAVVASGYFLTGSAFATAFLLSGERSADAPASFLDAFFMSLQALTVFGCGRLSPGTPLAKWTAAGAVFVGWLALLFVLALTMVRFIHLRPFWRTGNDDTEQDESGSPVRRNRPDCN